MPIVFRGEGCSSYVVAKIGCMSYLYFFMFNFHRFGEAFKPEGEEEFAKLQLKELKNGRLAMVAIMGQLIQEGLTKQ